MVAIDKDPQDQQREGAPSNRVDVNANHPPNPPINLILSKDGNGDSVLQWTAPPVPDPDGDPIAVVPRLPRRHGHRRPA